MLIQYKISKYEQTIKIQGNKIYYFNCGCPDFLFRKIYTNERCKHINKIKEMMDKEIVWDTALALSGLSWLTEEQSNSDVKDAESMRTKSENSQFTESSGEI